MTTLKMKTTEMILGLCLGLFCVSTSFAQIITTVAGNGVQGSGGNNGPAMAASLSQPHGVAVDAAGNIYIADSVNNCIRKVTAATGIISTVAGMCGSPDGYSGEGDPATQADMNFPFNVALDASGNLYFSDKDNHVVRKVDTAGIITTIAGIGIPCVAPYACGDGGPATSALLHSPTGIAVDNAGNVYIADAYNYRIRKVNSAGVISTIAGNPNNPGNSGDGGLASVALLHTPYSLAFDGSGNLYFVEWFNHVVRKIAAVGTQITSTSTISRVAGVYAPLAPGFSGDGGLATLAKMNHPSGLAIDAWGNLYISDRENKRIRKVTTANIISTICGNGNVPSSGDNGPAILAQVDDPNQLATDACGNLYIADYGGHRIRKISNGTVPVFNPNIVSATPVCSGKNISAKGLYAGSIPPDSYSWQLQSCTTGGVVTSAYNSGVLNYPNAPPTTLFSFPNTANLACNQHYLITFTVKKNCPVPTTAQVTKQIFIKCKPTPVITGDTTICHGGSTTLCTANYPNNSQYTVTWVYQAGGAAIDIEAQCINVSPTANTTYGVSVTDNTTGCTGTASTTVTVVKLNPDFTYQTNYTSPNNYFKISATPVAPYSTGVPGFGDLWLVQQLDASGNIVPGTDTSTGIPPSPPCWGIYPATNTFDGFDGTKSSGIHNVSCTPPSPSPGRFLNGATYRIIHGVWSSDCPWAQTSRIVTVAGNKIRGNRRDEDVNAPDYRHLKPSVRGLTTKLPFPHRFNLLFSFLGQQNEKAGSCSLE